MSDYNEIPKGILDHIIDDHSKSYRSWLDRPYQGPPTLGIAHCWACRSYQFYRVSYDRCAGHLACHAVPGTNWLCMGSRTPIGALGSRTGYHTTELVIKEVTHYARY